MQDNNNAFPGVQPQTTPQEPQQMQPIEASQLVQPVQPVQPVIQQPVQPVVSQPVQPVVSQPVQPVQPTMQSNFQKTPNRLMGVLGILLGVAIGSIVYILIYKIGFIASVAGILMTGLAVFFYEKFSGTQMDKIGYIITGVVLAVAVYFSTKIGLAMIAAESMNADFGVVYGKLFTLLDRLDLTDDFILDIFKGIAFCAVGFVTQLPAVKNKINKR